MKHVGDITKLDGSTLEPVWCITGGSPCQDLSMAGKRAGLAGERSGLFMEQIRIIKEMRSVEHYVCGTDKPVRLPRYAVWENVPGAFSSNNGYDFLAVLEEFAKCAQPEIQLPMPNRGGDKLKWDKAGCIDGDGWSIAWRLHDAQYWGVPQRRKRIAVVVDFDGNTAAEIQSQLESLRGNSAEGEEPWERAAGDVADSTGATGYDGYNGKLTGDISATLGVNCGMSTGRNGIVLNGHGAYQMGIPLENHPADGRIKIVEDGIVQTLTSRMGTGGGNVPMVMRTVSLEGNGQRPSHKGDGYSADAPMYTLNTTEVHATAYGICSYESNSMRSSNPHSGVYEADTCRTLDLNCGNPGCNQGGIAVVEPVFYEDQGGQNMGEVKDKAPTIRAQAHGHQTLVCGTPYRQIQYDTWGNDEVSATLKAEGGSYGGGSENVVGTDYIVCRLTPLECERFQGFPDNWTDIDDWVDSKGKKHKGDSDAPRYKALGNSIALPYWYWMLNRMAAYLPERATLGSLFDGIGGFPLCWETIHGKGTARWASEIEEFPIAVTKLRFGEE